MNLHLGNSPKTLDQPRTKENNKRTVVSILSCYVAFALLAALTVWASYTTHKEQEKNKITTVADPVTKAEKLQKVQERYDELLKAGDNAKLEEFILEWAGANGPQATLLEGLDRNSGWRKNRLKELSDHELAMSELEISEVVKTRRKAFGQKLLRIAEAENEVILKFGSEETEQKLFKPFKP